MRRLVCAALLCLTGCGSTDAIEGPVRLGQIAAVGGPRVQPERVIEDSRCPMNARCVWAGRVVLRTKVFGGTWPKTLDLVLGVPADVADGKLTLVAVTPDRVAGRSARTEPSRFAFAFQGGL